MPPATMIQGTKPNIDYDPMGILNAMISRCIKETTPVTVTMSNGVTFDGIITRADPMQVGTGYVPNAFLLLSPNPRETAIDMDNAMDVYIRIEEVSHIGIMTKFRRI